MTSSQPYSLSQIKNGMTHFLFGKLLSVIAGLLTTFIFVRELPSEDYAAFSVLFGLTILVGSTASFLGEPTAERFIPELIASKQKTLLGNVIRLIIWVRFVMVIVVLGILVLAAPYISELFSLNNYINDIPYWTLSIFSIVFFNFNLFLLEIFAMQRVTKWISIAVSFVRLGTVIFFMLTPVGLNLFRVVSVEIISNGLGCVMAMYTVHRFLKEKTSSGKSPAGSADYFKRIYSYSFYNYFRNIVFLLTGEASNRLVVAKYLNADQVAAFGFAQSLSSMALRYMPSMFLRNLFRPAMMAQYDQNGSGGELTAKANFIFKADILLLMPVLIWIALAGNEIGALLSDWKYPSVGGILLVLLVIIVIESHYSILETHLQAREESRVIFEASLLLAFFLLPGAFLIQVYGVTGFLTARFFGVLARSSMVGVRLSLKGVKKTTDWRGVLLIFGAAGLPVTILWPFHYPNIPLTWAVAKATAATIFYFVALFTMKPFSSWEKDVFNRVTNRKIFKPKMES